MRVADIHDEQIGFAVRRVVGDDFVVGDAHPCAFEPSEPSILRMGAIGRDYPELGLHNIARTAA